MARYCGYRPRGGGARVTGAVLMALGALVFLLFVPDWVWASALGVCLISVGYLMWRFADCQ